MDGTVIPVKNGESFRLKAVIDPKSAKKTGFRVRCGGGEHTDIYVDLKEQRLVMDTTESGSEGWKIKEQAPFTLEVGEEIQLDLFVDKSVVEVYVNQCQAICRRVTPPFRRIPPAWKFWAPTQTSNSWMSGK